MENGKMWKDFSKSDLELCLKEPYQFFMIRVKGLHPGRGGRFCPTIVQLIDNQLFTCENELEPLIFSHKNDIMSPETDPFECNLEWCEIPE